MDAFHFNHVTEYEYNVIVLCTEIQQRNLDCFDDAKDQLLIKVSIKQTISKLEKRISLSPFEFFVVLHAIHFLCVFTNFIFIFLLILSKLTVAKIETL